MRKIEQDRALLTAGVRFGETLGGPVLIEVLNADHKNWTEVLSPTPLDDSSAAEAAALYRPRPGHADLVGYLKYGRKDLRDVLERASARNTCVRVAAGAIAKILLAQIGVRVFSIVTQIGGIALTGWPAVDFDELERLAEESEVRCPDTALTQAMKDRIDEAKKRGDTVGGRFSVIATGVPAGLGSYVEWDRKLDGRLAQAVMSIQAVKAVEIGIGVENGVVFGSEAHDEIVYDLGAHPTAGGYGRSTNRAGGVEGGTTNGQPVVVHGTMKPISTLATPLASVDVRTHDESKAGYERSDVCAVPACGVIAEAAVAFTLADAALEAYGGDTLEDFRRAHQEVLKRFARS